MKNILIIKDNLLKTDRKMKDGFRCLIIYILFFILCYLLLKFINTVYIMLVYMLTMSISTGLYPTLDLWNTNKLHYITFPSLYPTTMASW